MSLISVSLQTEFREFCVNHLVLRQINTFFTKCNITKGTAKGDIKGERRFLVEEYYESIDWTRVDDAQKFLDVISLILSQSYIDEEQKSFLRELCLKEGHVVERDKVYLRVNGSGAGIKNLIFAADGPKPEIVLSDAVNNDISVVENERYCLIYDEPVLDRGLLWKDLVSWYSKIIDEEFDDRLVLERTLYVRLQKSLMSSPEKLLFKTYFGKFKDLFGDNLPALIPQVYLHYDPFTITQLAEAGKGKRLIRQRMDFLLLFSHRERIVIEVDGKQHYAENDRASPARYSEMVAEDRKLKLAGYEIYRFGGYELNQENSEHILENFFSRLFQKHNIKGLI